ncbi:metal-dependent transcriptional regulator [Ignisphaera sp. 4213-co]|uniref:Metal-dependent transcriptional regulator n=1 Tax=Ignisphaera cupida TaxID=3050454 RepID=A0ABD4Z570_9CREN|nr:metal-dependent transcriptional regulator [Ignisphaera sp. 4213-co]MDK6028462.1 metal-dependent transcriptional regulator [Ignisphaera sp. 4213-co]
MNKELRTLEDYLKAIYRLEEVLGHAKTSDIAKELGVTAATVSKTLRKLESNGYVIWLPYEGVRLSDRGRKIAVDIVKKHRIAESFLYHYLGFDLVKAHEYAHMLEHMPSEFFERLWLFMKKPSVCPHGNLIPGLPKYNENEIKEIENDKPLANFDKDAKVKITRILCSFQYDLMKTLINANISRGTIVTIEKKDSLGIVVKSPNNISVKLPYYQANLIRGLEITST